MLLLATKVWEQRRLGEMITERKILRFDSREFPLSSFIKNEGVVPKSSRYDRSFLVKSNSKKYKETRLGDFIYSSNNLDTGSIGLNNYGNAVISPVYSVFTSKDTENLETSFINLLFKKNFYKNKMLRFRQGVTYGQWKIKENDFLNLKVYTSNSIEIEKIIAIFSKISQCIALYERKLQLNLKLYAELLNQFIPDKNSKSILNKINWQSISLGKIAHLQKGKQKNRNDISEVRNDKETYPVYNGGKEKSGYTDEYNRNDSIIISEGGNSAGYVNYIAGKFYSGGHNYSIEPQNIDSSLLYLILLRNQSRIMNLRTGSGLPNIKISSLKSFKIFIPSKNDNLYDFDKLLILLTKDNNLIKDKLNKLKLIKKTLLNTMFI